MQGVRPLSRSPAGVAPWTLPAREAVAEVASGWDRAAWALYGVLTLAAFLTLRDYGISNDEEVQHRYGELIIAYYQSGFTDRALFDYGNLYLYGGLFDILAVLLAKALPQVDVFLIRHALCALAGIGGIMATGAVARLVAGPRAGFLAALLLATTAPWYGAMFNHTKDIPFAAAMMGATFFLLRMMRDLPQPRWRDTLGFGVMVGAACGLRAMGLLPLGYAGLVALYGLVEAVRTRRMPAATFVGRCALRLLPGVLLGYLIMLATWPWAAQSPLNPLAAILTFAHFHYPIRTIFAGAVYDMANVPRYYVTAYLLIRVPLLVLAGALASALFVRLQRQAGSRVPPAAGGAVALLWFSIAFPLVAQIVGHGPAFTGMRHFFFVVPPLAALAGIGAEAAFAWLAARKRALAAAMAVGVAAIIGWQVTLLVRLHPHQYVYYNSLVGGLPGAAGRYSTDYWVNIMPEAVGALKRYLDAQQAEPGRAYTVGVCGERFSFEHERDARMQWTPGWYEADFFIAPTHMGCDRATNGKIVYRIERQGVLLGVVKDRRGYPSPAAKAAAQ